MFVSKMMYGLNCLLPRGTTNTMSCSSEDTPIINDHMLSNSREKRLSMSYQPRRTSREQTFIFMGSNTVRSNTFVVTSGTEDIQKHETPSLPCRLGKRCVRGGDEEGVLKKTLERVFSEMDVSVSSPKEGCTKGQETVPSSTVENDVFDGSNGHTFDGPGRSMMVLLEQEPLPKPMSLTTNFLAPKEPFTIAKFAKNVPHKSFPSKRVVTPKLQEKSKQAVLRKMGNANLKVPTAQAFQAPHDDPYVKRSLQRIRRNGQREVHKNQWRAEKRALAAAEPYAEPQDVLRQHIPKRATYKKARAILENEKVSAIATNKVSSTESLPSRSDVLPPDGGSLRSDVEKTMLSTKCSSCVAKDLKLSHSYAQKGAIGVALEKTKNDLSRAQMKIKKLEQEIDECRNSKEQAMSTTKALEQRLRQIQNEKAFCEHELNVASIQLSRVIEQSDVSDCSHVSSVYVSGSQKTLDDGLGEDVSPDDEEEYVGEMDDWAKHETDVHCISDEDKANAMVSKVRQLEAELKEFKSQPMHFRNKDCSTQTFRRDGTFTRQQPDKTKIPQRLLGHHSSLPVITDPPAMSSNTNTWNSSSRESLAKHVRNKDAEFIQLQTQYGKLISELDEVKKSLRSETIKRKQFFNLAEDLKGKIRVFCRVKPREDECRTAPVLEVPDDYTILLRTQRGRCEFVFDRIFADSGSQQQVFDDVQSSIQSVLDGYNVCIFAYGQTGSGKTYTLIGDERQPGIAPRAFSRLFNLMRASQNESDYRISATVFELYNDKLIDLLNFNEDKLKIRRDRHGVVYVEGSGSRQVQDEGELLDLFQYACTNRHTASTRMNTCSSRSHLIITILIESTNKLTGTVLKGKLSIVDLAGSERVGKSAAVAEQLREANSINKSLSALGDVISALSLEQSHVPYRNNKLTMLMQDSLGNNAKTLMFVTISASDFNVEESLNSLTYASRVKQITNSATRIADSKEVARLRSIILKLTKDDKSNKY